MPTPTEPIRSSTTLAASIAVWLAPWITGGLFALAMQWSIDLPDGYELQTVAVMTSIMHWLAGEWARRRVTAARHYTDAEIDALRKGDAA